MMTKEQLEGMSLEGLLEEFPETPSHKPSPSSSSLTLESLNLHLPGESNSRLARTDTERKLRRRSMDYSFYGKPKEMLNGSVIPSEEGATKPMVSSNDDNVAFEAPEEEREAAPIISPLIVPVQREKTPFEPSLLARGVKKQLSAEEQQTLAASLLELPQEEAISHLNKAYATNESQLADVRRKNAFTAFFKPGNQIPQITVSKTVLEFGVTNGGLAPLNKPLSDSIVVSCKLGNAKFSLQAGKPAKTHAIKINPQSGIIKRKTTLTINFTLEFRTTISLRQVICLDVEAVGRFFFLISLNSEKSVFGVDLSQLPCSPDPDNGLVVPTVLWTMKRYLFDHQGLTQEGVFRLAGDELETMEVKAKLNAGTFTGCNDVNCVANLLKVWFREFPESLLNQLPSSTFLSIEDEAACVAAYETMKDTPRVLFDWLLDMLSEVALLEEKNKMNPRNLAIVVAPNLFEAPDDNPMESLMLSQKVVNFTFQVLNNRVKQKQLSRTK